MFDEESYGEDMIWLLNEFVSSWNSYKEQKEYADRLRIGRSDFEDQMNNLDRKEPEGPDELYIGKCKDSLQKVISCLNARIEAVDRQNLKRHDYIEMLGEDIFNLNKTAFRRIGPWYRDQIEKTPEELKNMESHILNGPEELNRALRMMQEEEEIISMLRKKYSKLKMKYNRIRKRGGLDL